ncbi:MAG: signal peptidase I [Lachnospiraceae bacterium]|nr:signal peptidase I [Lachnospiraceae bacterium]
MEGNEQKQTRLKTHLGGILFYGILIAIVVLVFFFTRGEASGVPRHFAGFTAMRVLTSSMQSELPQDSLIITRQVPADEIRVGDDITFMVNENTTVTHRVILVYEDYRGTGRRGFQTQGIENPSPDREIVDPMNVVGRVVWHNLFLGQALKFIAENVLYVGILVALLIAFIACMRIIFSPKKKAEAQRKLAEEQRVLEENQRVAEIEQEMANIINNVK